MKRAPHKQFVLDLDVTGWKEALSQTYDVTEVAELAKYAKAAQARWSHIELRAVRRLGELLSGEVR
jgi:hypothetical protein